MCFFVIAVGLHRTRPEKCVRLHAHARVRTAVVCLSPANPFRRAERWRAGARFQSSRSVRRSDGRIERLKAKFKATTNDDDTKKLYRLPSSGSDQTTGKTPDLLGGIMTGLGRVTAVSADSLSSTSSSVAMRLVRAPSCHGSSFICSARNRSAQRADDTASTTAIRGTAPPPLG